MFCHKCHGQGGFPEPEPDKIPALIHELLALPGLDPAARALIAAAEQAQRTGTFPALDFINNEPTKSNETD